MLLILIVSSAVSNHQPQFPGCAIWRGGCGQAGWRRRRGAAYDVKLVDNPSFIWGREVRRLTCLERGRRSCLIALYSGRSDRFFTSSGSVLLSAWFAWMANT